MPDTFSDYIVSLITLSVVLIVRIISSHFYGDLLGLLHEKMWLFGADLYSRQYAHAVSSSMISSSSDSIQSLRVHIELTTMTNSNGISPFRVSGRTANRSGSSPPISPTCKLVVTGFVGSSFSSPANQLSVLSVQGRLWRATPLLSTHSPRSSPWLRRRIFGASTPPAAGFGP